VIPFVLAALMVAASVSPQKAVVCSDLNDASCGSEGALVIETEEASVVARCTASRSGSTVELTVENKTATRGRLDDLTVRFCGTVLTASAPRGWNVDIKTHRSASGQAADNHVRLVDEIVNLLETR
jgi:hypothetical protein